MKWYDIEYAGGSSSKSIIGQTDIDLGEILNTPNLPKFIKIENISYFSKLSEKYELYEKWDSKWENEMWINTSSIVSFRKIKSDLLSKYTDGEWNAFSNNIPFSIIISKQFADSNRKNFESVFLIALDKLIFDKAKHLTYGGNPTIIEQELLSENEFILTQYGNILIRKKVSGIIENEILGELDKYFSKFSQEKEDE